MGNVKNKCVILKYFACNECLVLNPALLLIVEHYRMMDPGYATVTSTSCHQLVEALTLVYCESSTVTQ